MQVMVEVREVISKVATNSLAATAVMEVTAKAVMVASLRTK